LIELERCLHSTYSKVRKWVRKRKYLSHGQIPWSLGYWEYRNDFVRDVLRDVNLLERFASNQELPRGYGYRLDERVVEYPWVISRLCEHATHLLDAGSALNFEFLLQQPSLRKKNVVLYTLAAEYQALLRENVSYVYGDLRRTILRDQVFEEIVCISTLEHIGLDNTLIYTRDQRYNEMHLLDYRDVVREFRRLLTANGRIFLTVPYGKYQNHGWLQQFDHNLLHDAFQVFDGRIEDQAFYRYTSEGWVWANAAECADCEYYNVHARSNYDPDYAAAARAVACVVLSG
jgi:hypothetical protein